MEVILFLLFKKSNFNQIIKIKIQPKRIVSTKQQPNKPNKKAFKIKK